MVKEETEIAKKKEEKVVKTLVVQQLPTEQIKKVIGDDGIEYNLLTIEEAISEILEVVKQLKKGLI